jgi:hypothetical protein
VSRIAVPAALLLALACEDGSYRAIGAEIRLLSGEGSVPEEPAIARLSAFGQRAIPQIEIALHTAADRGRLRLVGTLDRIGDAEAVPILRHFAVYDPSVEVRQACEGVLQRWSTQSDGRRQRALSALQAIGEKRARGEGPLPEKPGR